MRTSASEPKMPQFKTLLGWVATHILMMTWPLTPEASPWAPR